MSPLTSVQTDVLYIFICIGRLRTTSFSKNDTRVNKKIANASNLESKLRYIKKMSVLDTALLEWISKYAVRVYTTSDTSVS